MSTPQYQPPPPQPAYYPPAQRTNSLAVVSLVTALVGIFFAPISLVAVITGHIARRQIAETGEQGDGLAVAGLIIGYVWMGIFALMMILYILFIVGMFAFIAAGGGATP